MPKKEDTATIKNEADFLEKAETIIAQETVFESEKFVELE
jgi:hypothetical protein